MKTCWAQWLFLALVATLSIGQMLTACGNKRPLYLPSEAGELSQADKDKKEKLKELLRR